MNYTVKLTTGVNLLKIIINFEKINKNTRKDIKDKKSPGDKPGLFGFILTASFV